jgi:hypothetical protein
MFLHEQQVEKKKKSLELEQPWRENYGVYLEQKTEEPGCQA